LRTHRNCFKEELPGFSRLLGARLSAWASVIAAFTSLDLISSMAMMQPRMQAEGIGRSPLEKPRLYAVPASSMLSIVSPAMQLLVFERWPISAECFQKISWSLLTALLAA